MSKSTAGFCSDCGKMTGDKRALRCQPCDVKARSGRKRGESRGGRSYQSQPAPAATVGIDLSEMAREIADLTERVKARQQERQQPPPAPQPPDALVQLAEQIRGLKELLEQERQPENVLWQAASTLANYHQQHSPPDHLPIVAPDNLPIAMAVLPDAHIGGSGTAYQLMLRDATLISRTPGLVPLCLGDVAQNFITPGKLAAVSRSDIIQPGLQWVMVRDWIRRMLPNRPIICPGNHDQWSKAVASIMPLQEIAQDMDCAYLDGHVARISVKYPSGITYDIAAAHHFRRNSSDNPTHRPFSMIRIEAQWADIAVCAHLHEGSWSHMRISGRERVGCNADSYKVFDRHAKDNNYAPSRAIIPVIVMDPAVKRMTVFGDLQSGCDYLTYLRQGK